MSKKVIIKGTDFSTNAVATDTIILTNQWMSGYYDNNLVFKNATSNWNTSGIFLLERGSVYRLTGLDESSRVYAFVNMPEEGTIPSTCDYRSGFHPVDGYEIIADSATYQNYSAFAVMRGSRGKSVLRITRIR